MRLEAAQLIHRPPDGLFQFVATDHFQNHPKWDPAVEKMTPTSPGPMAQGATAQLVRRNRGKAIEGTITVTDYQPVRTFAATSRFGPFALRQRASFEPAPGGATRRRPSRSSCCRRCSKTSLPWRAGHASDDAVRGAVLMNPLLLDASLVRRQNA
jgi:Polyketide cyclase / dehydrase and lipid transport